VDLALVLVDRNKNMTVSAFGESNMKIILMIVKWKYI
jgi:hypothetical protein